MGIAKSLWIEEQERGWSSIEDAFVCEECVFDYALKELVRDNVQSPECTYCGRTSTGDPIAADMNCLMEVVYAGICTEWGDPNSEGVIYESAEGGWQGEVIDSWTLLSMHLPFCGFVDGPVLEDLATSMADRQWCQRNFYRLLPQEELAFDWGRFRELVKYQSRFFFLKEPGLPDEERAPHEILDVLGHFIRDFDLVRTLGPGTVLFRARRHGKNEHPTTIADLGPPPRRKAFAANRMSPAGITMFYGAFEAATARAEVCSDVTDSRPKVTVAPFALTKAMQVVDLSAAPSVPSLFDPKRADERVPAVFLREFMKDFTAPVEKDGCEHIDYVPTQIVTEYLRRVFRDRHNSEIQGVVYPSSVADGNSCVLFLEEVPTDGLAYLRPNSAEKWLNLDSAHLQTTRAIRPRSQVQSKRTGGTKLRPRRVR